MNIEYEYEDETYSPATCKRKIHLKSLLFSCLFSIIVSSNK